jgi:hypothetical protein
LNEPLKELSFDRIDHSDAAHALIYDAAAFRPSGSGKRRVVPERQHDSAALPSFDPDAT